MSFAAVFLLLATSPAWASPGGQALIPAARGMAPAAAELAAQEKASQEFLALPAFDAERVVAAPKPGAEPTPDRVGDVAHFKIPGFKPEGPGAAYKISVPGDGGGADKGWILQAVERHQGPEVQFAVVMMKGGKLEIPSLQIASPEGKAVARTHPIVLQPESAIAADDPKPKEAVEPKPPVSLRFPWMILAFAGLVALLLGAAVTYLLARWLGKSKPKKEVPKPVEAPRPEDEVALEALAQLAKQGYLQQRKFKPHYFGISETLKIYLGRRYGVDAEESTSRELCQLLQQETGATDVVLREIENVFAKLDFVKFTDHVPPEQEGEELLERARKLVLQTRKHNIQLGPALTPAGIVAESQRREKENRAP